MKAIVYKNYGGPEVLTLTEVDTPIPGEGEVQVKIMSTTVNRTDTGFREATYLAVRVVGGLFHPKQSILGTEFSGIVSQIGEGVTLFKPGDFVFGLNTYQFGTHAEYICVPEDGSITLMPENLSFNEAAAVCDGMMLANNYIKRINFKRRPQLLINGATGSIGIAALQLAKYHGAKVTAVGNTKNLKLLKQLGADEVIDYTQEDFTQRDKKYDTVLDAVGKSSFFACKKIMNSGATYYSSELGYMWQNVFLPFFTGYLGGKKMRFPIPTDSKEDIQYFKMLLEFEHYKPVIDKVFSMEQFAEAHAYVDTGEKTGNVVIEIAKP